ncbi:MAG: FmdB family zinc ribbon protein [Planctomycetota bacterium]
MPTYDYECQACGNRHEVFQGITEGTLRKCPECGKLRLRRLIGTGGGIIFKGSGFYETDYRSSSYKAQANKEASAPATTDKADSSPKPKSGNESTASKNGGGSAGS